jgi:hypothetical protein
MMKKICFIFVLIIGFSFEGQSQDLNQNDTMKTKQVNIGDRKVPLTILNKKETKELISVYHGKEKLSLSKKYDSHAYILNDNRLVLAHEGGGALYASEKDLEDLMSFLNKNAKAHPLENGLPNGVYYLTHIDSIIQEFSQKIQIDSARMDKTLESLKIIESKLKELRLDEFQLEREYLVYLMTYCGEIIRKNVGGDWTLKELTINNKLVYEPVIRVQENRDYSPLWPIYNEMTERPSNFSFYTALDAEIDKYKLMDAILKKQK